MDAPKPDLPAGFWMVCALLICLHLAEEATTLQGLTHPLETVLVALFGADLPYFPTQIAGLLFVLAVMAIAGLMSPLIWPHSPWALRIGQTVLAIAVLDSVLIHCGALFVLGGPSSQTLGAIPGLASGLLLILPMGIVWIRLVGWQAARWPLLIGAAAHLVAAALTLLVLAAQS